jgi:poly-beta-hydroxyalkanoate depolymerase
MMMGSSAEHKQNVYSRRSAKSVKRHHMQAGVGHYGVFSGKRWENQIYPILKNVILSSD